MKLIKVSLFVFLYSIAATSAFSHSGGTNSEGCHNNTSTGSYHCH